MSDYESDNDAPESVSFSQSRTEALQKIQDASKSAKEEKLKLKEKRKKRDEIFKAQKREKLERLAKLMPTEDELRQAGQEIDAADKSTKIEIDNKKSTKKIFDESEGDDNVSEADESSPKNTRFRVVNAKKDIGSKLESSVAESVLKFRETMLFGAGSKNRREASEDVVRRKQKIKLVSKS